MKKLLFPLFVCASLAACAVAPVREHVAAKGSFKAEAFFVLEFEHDTNGNLVHAAPYGPTNSEFKAEQDEAMRTGLARQYNPPGFTSQFTIQHVKFTGPLGSKGAVLTQPIGRNQPPPKSWVLFATDFSAHGEYLGAEMLHAVALALTCQHQARDIIDSTPRDDTDPHGVPRDASLLIYCVPVPPLPTSTTLPNGDSIL